MKPRILIAGVGNIFFGDDAFGCEVARRMASKTLPDGTRVVDFGIRSLDLTYALLDGYDLVILIDAVPRGGAPGTLYVIEPAPPPPGNHALDGHAMDPVKVMAAAMALGATLPRLLVVGCEPASIDAEIESVTDSESKEEPWHMALSPPVAAAVEEAVDLITSLVVTGGSYESVIHTGRGDERVPDPAAVL